MPKYWQKDVVCEGILDKIEKHKTNADREFLIIVLQQGEYIQAFEVYNEDVMKRANTLTQGAEIEVKGYATTREYMGKYYTTLRATRICVLSPPNAAEPPNDYVPGGGDEDVPF